MIDSFESFKEEFHVIFGDMSPDELIKEMREAGCDMEFLDDLEESDEENA